MTLLEVDNVSRDFAGLAALRQVSFNVAEGSITALIGPNGAGKTTLVNIIAGVLPPTCGVVRFRGTPIAGRSPTRVAALGIRRTFQTVRLFPGLTVMENLVIGQFHDAIKGHLWRALLPIALGDVERRRRARALLERFGLGGVSDIVAAELPYGTQRRVEIARALSGEPRLLLLDEPAAGMNEAETEHLRADISVVRDGGVTVFLVEHDMLLVMAISDRIVVLDFGRKITEGTPDEVRRDPGVISSYLGDG